MCKQGEVYIYNAKGEKNTNIQAGRRYCVVISNNANNKYSNTVNVIPFTSKCDKNSLPCHAIINPSMFNGLKLKSAALVEQIDTIQKTELREKVGKLNLEEMHAVVKAIEVQFDLHK